MLHGSFFNANTFGHCALRRIPPTVPRQLGARRDHSVESAGSAQ